MDVSNLGNVIRWPFEMLGKIINFILSHWLVIFIIVFTIYVFYYIFSRGIIGRIVELINTPEEENIEIMEEKCSAHNIKEDFGGVFDGYT